MNSDDLSLKNNSNSNINGKSNENMNLNSTDSNSNSYSPHNSNFPRCGDSDCSGVCKCNTMEDINIEKDLNLDISRNLDMDINKANNDLIFFNDNNYSIYKIKKWKYDYKINFFGLENEVPATEITRNQLLNSMEEIRKDTFTFQGKKINAMLGLAIRYNNLFDMNLDNLIANEEIEYIKLKNELNSLELEDSNNFVDLNSSNFLIYEITKNLEGMLVSRPANHFTKSYHKVGICIQNSK